MTRTIVKIIAVSLGLFLVGYSATAVKKVSFINQAKCLKCGTCFKVCPVKAPQKTEKNGKIISMVIDVNKCLGCGTCVKKCPAKAISLVDPKDIKDGKLVQATSGAGAAGEKAAGSAEGGASTSKEPVAPEKK